MIDGGPLAAQAAMIIHFSLLSTGDMIIRTWSKASLGHSLQPGALMAPDVMTAIWARICQIGFRIAG
jgi:hypothetical protein